jgi:hypothetical protein
LINNGAAYSKLVYQYLTIDKGSWVHTACEHYMLTLHKAIKDSTSEWLKHANSAPKMILDEHGWHNSSIHFEIPAAGLDAEDL